MGGGKLVLHFVKDPPTHCSVLKLCHSLVRVLSHFFSRRPLLVTCVLLWLPCHSVHPALPHPLNTALHGHHQVDARHPMQREWALLAVRNMCMDNPDVQEEIASLKAVGVVAAPELAALGVRADLGPDGKVRVTQGPRPSST
jgi:hypothetical protein